MKTTLIEHLESYSGRITHGWADSESGAPAFQVASFSGGPFLGARMVSTLGLSQYEMILGDGRTHGRHELTMLFREGNDEAPLAAILKQVGLERLAAHRACLQGETIGPRDPLIAGSDLVSLYCTSPVYFPDEFRLYRSERGYNVMILWLVPITLAETEFCLTHGWSKFEKLLVEMDPDLTDLHRKSLL